MSRNSYIKGAGILAIGGLLSRFIGLFYKSLITKALGSYAMGLYYNTFFILNFLLSFIIGAVPLTISKMIAEKRALGDTTGLKKIMITISLMLTALGIIFTYIILFHGKSIIHLAGWDENTYYPLIGLSFAPMLIIYVCMIRGFFQGMNIMKPTAISQIGESLARLLIGVPLCYYFASHYHQALGAGGATFGITLSEAFGLVIIFGYFIRYKKIESNTLYGVSQSDSIKTIIKRFYSIAIPVSITSVMLSLLGMVNSFTYATRLQVAGVSLENATRMFGDYSNASTLINIPMTISMAISVALLPAIAESNIKRDFSSICRKTASSLRVIFVIGFPCIIGLSIFSNEIFTLIFNDSPYGGEILKYSAFSIIFIMIAGTIQSVLQGMDIFKDVIRNIVIGIFIKFVLNYILIPIPSLNIQGMIISNFVSFGSIALLNYVVLTNYTGYRMKLFETIIKPLIASAIMGVFLMMLRNIVFNYFSSAISLAILIPCAVIFYLGVLLVTKTIKEEDIDMLPRSEKLKKIFNIYK